MVDAENFMWTGAINTEYDHNFAKYPLNDEEQYRRRLLYELDMSILALRARHGESAELARLTGCYHNLMRMWATT